MDPNGPSDGTLREALEAARPQPDDLAMEQARARLEDKLFDNPGQPARLGRFVLLEQIGRGGMGSVYSAYDPELDRRVALKVLRQHLVESGARSQLKKEARSLARLSNPNVVPVHDVVEFGERLVLVMEYVSGSTVYQWQNSEPRSWKEIVEVYGQIGDGIAAAHALGIVHRDVKPQNAIIGDDGRVRVVDFGLARLGNDADPPANGHPDALETLTVSGAIAGTPAYMSPEQFEADGVGPASDQFSFCVALYRALYGQRPFEGATPEQLHRSVIAGSVRPPPRDRAVPRWVHAAVVRGLERDPDDRHESIGRLCALLRRDPARVRWRRAGIVAVLALGGLVAWSLARGDDAGVSVCDGGPDRLAAVWNDTRRSALHDALSMGGAYGVSITGPLLAELDDYGRRFVALHRDACMAHQRGEQSAALLDKRMYCLEGRVDALDGAVASLLEVDSSTVTHARDVVANLPAIDFCADTAALAAEYPPPEDPKRRVRAEALRKRMSAVNSLSHLRRLSEALKRAKTIAKEATALGHPPITAKAHLAVGRIHMLEREFATAAEVLRVVEETGLEHGLLTIAVEATARRIYSEGVLGADLDVITRQFELIEPLSRRLTDGGFARALLFNNVGVAYMAHGDQEAARRYFEHAHGESRNIVDPPTELQSIVKNLAMVTPEPDKRRVLVAEALEEVRARLGDNHALALEFGVGYAHYVVNPEDAYTVLKPTCSRYGQYHSDQALDHLRCLYYQGFLETELGRSEAAAETFETAAGLGPTNWHQAGAASRNLATGAALLLTRRFAAAIDRFRGVIATLPARPRSWWFDEVEGHARLGIGSAHLAKGNSMAAADELQVAIERFESILSMNQDVENRQRLALARLLRARSLRGQDLDTAASLFKQAESWYRSVSETVYRTRLAAISQDRPR